MSHWKTFKSDVLTNTNVDMLRTALGEIGVGLDTNRKQISNTWGKEDVDMAFSVNGRGVALGLKQVGDKMELRGDFYGTGLRENEFMDKLTQVYKKIDIVDRLENNGWTVEDITQDQNGDFLINAYQYA